jgi:cyclin-dependent kinase 10
MTTLLSLTGKEQTLKLAGFYGAATPVHVFEKLNQIGEGSIFRSLSPSLTIAFGVVLYRNSEIGPNFISRARDRRTGGIVALKTIRIDTSERRDGTPITAVREISLLRSLKHPNIVNVIEVAIGGNIYDPPVRPAPLKANGDTGDGIL